MSATSKSGSNGLIDKFYDTLQKPWDVGDGLYERTPVNADSDDDEYGPLFKLTGKMEEKSQRVDESYWNKDTYKLRDKVEEHKEKSIVPGWLLNAYRANQAQHMPTGEEVRDAYKKGKKNPKSRRNTGGMEAVEAELEPDPDGGSSGSGGSGGSDYDGGSDPDDDGSYTDNYWDIIGNAADEEHTDNYWDVTGHAAYDDDDAAETDNYWEVTGNVDYEELTDNYWEVIDHVEDGETDNYWDVIGHETDE